MHIYCFRLPPLRSCHCVVGTRSFIIIIIYVKIHLCYDPTGPTNTGKNGMLSHYVASCTVMWFWIFSSQGTALLTLNTAGVVGVAIALLVVIATCYTCGLLTGLLVRRKRKHVSSASGDLSAPTYEQVLPSTQTSIPLKENEAYGQVMKTN
jgi:hypothetical protein